MKKLLMIGAMVAVFGLGTAAAFAASADKPPSPSGQDENAQVCPAGDSGKIDVSGSQASITVTAPAGKLISGFCVKAGSANQDLGPEFYTVSPPAKSVTITHSSGKDISHYSLTFVDDETTETHPTETTPTETTPTHTTPTETTPTHTTPTETTPTHTTPTETTPTHTTPTETTPTHTTPTETTPTHTTPTETTPTHTTPTETTPTQTTGTETTPAETTSTEEVKPPVFTPPASQKPAKGKGQKPAKGQTAAVAGATASASSPSKAAQAAPVTR